MSLQLHHPVELPRGDWGPRPPLASKVASVRLDVLLFSSAAVILALHTAVDSFIAPEPGTRPGDHLLRGVASLVLIALTAFVFPRLPAGGRAAMAAAIGAFALEAAVLAIADARAVGARGEDWTGFLLLPVGIALLVLSASLLWRSRRPGRLPTCAGPGSRLQSPWRRTGSSCRSRSRSSPRIARARMSCRPISGARTRK